jgi:hypothetical protein
MEQGTHCLDEDDAMAVVDGIPRCTNSEGYIGGPALKEGVVDVSLKLRGTWNGRARWGVHGDEVAD